MTIANWIDLSIGVSHFKRAVHYRITRRTFRGVRAEPLPSVAPAHLETDIGKLLRRVTSYPVVSGKANPLADTQC
jgi:hypothetical protein